MLSRVALPALLVTATLVPHASGSSLRHLFSGPPPTCVIEHSFDYVGHDLTNVKGDYNSCCSQCADVRGCKAWSWTDFNGGTCWLKSGRGEIVLNAQAKSALFFGEAQPRCQTKKDLDFVGNDLARVDAGSATRCCDACQNHPGCRAYSWSDFQGGSCWLKSKVTEVAFKAGVQSAQAYPEESTICWVIAADVDIVGNDIGSRRSTTPEGCCDICKTVAACRVFSWSNYEGGTCWLKSKKGTPIPKAGVMWAQVYPDAL